MSLSRIIVLLIRLAVYACVHTYTQDKVGQRQKLGRTMTEVVNLVVVVVWSGRSMCISMPL